MNHRRKLLSVLGAASMLAVISVCLSAIAFVGMLVLQDTRDGATISGLEPVAHISITQRGYTLAKARPNTKVGDLSRLQLLSIIRSRYSVDFSYDEFLALTAAHRVLELVPHDLNITDDSSPDASLRESLRSARTRKLILSRATHPGEWLAALAETRVSSIQFESDSIAVDQIQAIKQYKALVGLRIGKPKFTASEIEAVSELNQLQELTLVTNAVADADLLPLTKLTNLRKLEIVSNATSGKAATAVLDAMPNLRVASIPRALIPVSSIQAYAQRGLVLPFHQHADIHIMSISGHEPGKSLQAADFSHLEPQLATDGEVIATVRGRVVEVIRRNGAAKFVYAPRESSFLSHIAYSPTQRCFLVLARGQLWSFDPTTEVWGLKCHIGSGGYESYGGLYVLGDPSLSAAVVSHSMRRMLLFDDQFRLTRTIDLPTHHLRFDSAVFLSSEHAAILMEDSLYHVALRSGEMTCVRKDVNSIYKGSSDGELLVFMQGDPGARCDALSIDDRGVELKYEVDFPDVLLDQKMSNFRMDADPLVAIIPGPTVDKQLSGVLTVTLDPAAPLVTVRSNTVAGTGSRVLASFNPGESARRLAVMKTEDSLVITIQRRFPEY